VAHKPVRSARAQRSTVAQPAASAQWPDDKKVLPHRNRMATQWQISPMCGGGAGRLLWSRKSATPQEASLRWVGAPGPAHEDGRHVRWLGTDGAAEIEARHDRGGLLEGGSGGARRKGTGGSSFTVVHCVEATWAYARRERGR
jgi:hypothetical protein